MPRAGGGRNGRDYIPNLRNVRFGMQIEAAAEGGTEEIAYRI